MFYSPEANPDGGLFIAFLEQVFFHLCSFLLRNVMFCTCAMHFFPGGGQEQLFYLFFLLDFKTNCICIRECCEQSDTSFFF